MINYKRIFKLSFFLGILYLSSCTQQIEEKKEIEEQPKQVIIKTEVPPLIEQPKEVKQLLTPKIYEYSKGEDDGRFTLGSGFTRIMYGYPIQFSTSHFIIKVNDKFATNNPMLSGYKNVTYISSQRNYYGETGSEFCDITFLFEGVKIIQKLIPVDKNFKVINIGEFGHHYNISYEILNERAEDINVGLIILIDTMIDDNDQAKMIADGEKIEKETFFDDIAIPNTVQIFQRDFDFKDFYSEINLGKNNQLKPNKVYIGNWPHFHSVLWDLNIQYQEYFDSAILLKWENHNISSMKNIMFDMYYGLPNVGMIKLKMNSKMDINAKEFYFNPNDHQLSQNEIKNLEEFLLEIGGNNIQGAIIEGFSDSRGEEDMNLSVSRKRAKFVYDFLVKNNVDKNYIITKAYGESMSIQDELSNTNGNNTDRKVILTIFY